jgi:hypothetical protein
MLSLLKQKKIFSALMECGLYPKLQSDRDEVRIGINLYADVDLSRAGSLEYSEERLADVEAQFRHEISKLRNVLTAAVEH